jgi:hypothetical protein
MMTTNELHDWLTEAKPYECAVYATGNPSPHECPANQRHLVADAMSTAMRLWEAGLVELHMRRYEGGFEYLIFKRREVCARRKMFDGKI